MEPDWPEYISKPQLPNGYSFSCLRQALGLGTDGRHPWYIRVTWTFPHLKHGTCNRILKFEPSYFASPIEAIDAAIKAINNHIQKRGGQL